ncbi:MAG: SDR family NAD(P)-dependent oxidoreductase [Dehalococcoidia bacterium]
MSKSQPFAGHTVLIVGAGSRYGRPLTIALAEAGANIAVAGSSRATDETFAVASVANELWALGGRYLTLTMDLQEPSSVVEAIGRTLTEFGKIDLLVNAVEFDAPTPFAETPDARWEEIIRRNLGGVYLTCKLAGQAMLDQGRGSIFNVVSDAVLGRSGSAALAAAQGGVLALTRSLAVEWRDRIAVNAVVLEQHESGAAIESLVPKLAGTLAERGDSPFGLTGRLFELV